MEILTRSRKISHAALFIVGLTALAPLAFAQNALETFKVAQQGGEVIVRVTMKEPLSAVPGSFTVANPARIAFDFPGTINAHGKQVTRLMFVVKTQGKVISTNGEKDELTGEVYWALFPEAATLQPVVMTAVIQP